jgi:type IV pilus assembly protein PilA
MLRKKRGQKGFTLIELLIVIAIIGILAAIAIPMYRSQTIKARMTEVTNGMSMLASAVSTYYQDNDFTFPPNALTTKPAIQNTLGLSLASLSRMSAVDVSTQGVITATIANVDGSVNTQQLILTPTVSATDNSISWAWTGSANMPVAYIPKQ